MGTQQITQRPALQPPRSERSERSGRLEAHVGRLLPIESLWCS
jgi:hypothetical protein